ncbi:hypothetical protein JXQ70_03570 [bacterium]|nr:hypothetical protein [bacterium]
MSFKSFLRNDFSIRGMSSWSGVLLLLMTNWLLLMNLPGCTRMSLTEQQRLEKLLERRIEQLMFAQSRRDAEEAYSFYSERYKKRISPFEFANKKFPKKQMLEVERTGYSIDSIEYSHNFTEALVFLTIKMKMVTSLLPVSGPVPFEVKDKCRWVLIDDQWYREPERVLENISGHRFYTYKH